MRTSAPRSGLMGGAAAVIALILVAGPAGGPTRAASVQVPAPPAAEQPPPPPAPTVLAGQQPDRFTGHPVTLDFQGADLRAVLRTFAEISGLNIVIDPTITGHGRRRRCATCRGIRRSTSSSGRTSSATPWTARSSASRRSTCWRRRKRSAQAHRGAGAGRRAAACSPCPSATPRRADLVPILTRSALSARGEVQVDARTNTLIVRDLPDRLTTAAELVQGARSAAAAGGDRGAHRADDARLRARHWRPVGIQRPRRSGAGQHDGPRVSRTAAASAAASAARRGPAGEPAEPASTCAPRRRPAPSASRSARSTAPSTSTSSCSQLESSGRGRLLSTPRVSTQNNVEAEMTQGVADSDSDGREQHRHGHLQGRRRSRCGSRRRSPRRTP